MIVGSSLCSKRSAAVLAQVWRDGARQARLAALLGPRRTAVEPLDRSSAKATGVLCGIAGTSDIVNASVVIAARGVDPSVVVTGDAGDLRRIDPALRLVEL